MTNRDYPGTTYYTIRNVSLYECLGWCRDEVDCSAAAFSFVVNPLAPIQETTCLLQNDTQAKKPSTSSGSNTSGASTGGTPTPQKAINMYYFTKAHLRSGIKKRNYSELSLKIIFLFEKFVYIIFFGHFKNDHDF
jgi:hypothetical protein